MRQASYRAAVEHYTSSVGDPKTAEKGTRKETENKRERGRTGAEHPPPHHGAAARGGGQQAQRSKVIFSPAPVRVVHKVHVDAANSGVKILKKARAVTAIVVRDLQAVLYNPSGIVLSDTQQAVLTNLEYFYLRVPGCTALLDSPAHLAAVLEVLAYRFMNVTSDPPITGGV